VSRKTSYQRCKAHNSYIKYELANEWNSLNVGQSNGQVFVGSMRLEYLDLIDTCV